MRKLRAGEAVDFKEAGLAASPPKRRRTSFAAALHGMPRRRAAAAEMGTLPGFRLSQRFPLKKGGGRGCHSACRPLHFACSADLEKSGPRYNAQASALVAPHPSAARGELPRLALNATQECGNPRVLRRAAGCELSCLVIIAALWCGAPRWQCQKQS
jgi:hypothetical protein